MEVLSYLVKNALEKQDAGGKTFLVLKNSCGYPLGHWCPQAKAGASLSKPNRLFPISVKTRRHTHVGSLSISIQVI